MYGFYNKRFFFVALVAMSVVFYCFNALATDIVLDDGTVIDVKKKENVFVSKKGVLYAKSKKDGVFKFVPVDPVGSEEEVVVTPEPVAECGPENIDLCEFGSVEYCTFFQESWDGTVTFESINFKRACDTNEDGVYTYCADYVPYQDGYTFADQTWERACPENPDFNPVSG